VAACLAVVVIAAEAAAAAPAAAAAGAVAALAYEPSTKLLIVVACKQGMVRGEAKEVSHTLHHTANRVAM
jgi:hypothetical protein